MLKRFRQIARFFAEDPFKDSQGRFKTRWEVSEKPNIQILQEHEIPTFKVKFDFKVDKKRVFDFDLPDDMKVSDFPLQI